MLGNGGRGGATIEAPRSSPSAPAGRLGGQREQRRGGNAADHASGAARHTPLHVRAQRPNSRVALSVGVQGSPESRDPKHPPTPGWLQTSWRRAWEAAPLHRSMSAPSIAPSPSWIQKGSGEERRDSLECLPENTLAHQLSSSSYFLSSLISPFSRLGRGEGTLTLPVLSPSPPPRYLCFFQGTSSVFYLPTTSFRHPSAGLCTDGGSVGRAPTGAACARPG